MLSPAQPDRIHVAFDDHCLVANAGLLLPVTLATTWAWVNWWTATLTWGDAPGRANAGDKMLTLVASALAGGDCIDDADALRAGGTARVLGCVVKAHPPWDLPAEFPVGPRAATRPGEPGVAGPGVGRRGRTRRRSVDHRPGLHPLRDLRAVQGGRAPPWVHRPARLSPDPRRGPLPAGDGGLGAPCRSHRTTHHAGRQRLLHPCHRRRLPKDEGPFLHHRPPAPRPAQPHRGHTEGDWTPLPYWMEGAAAVAETAYTPFQGEPDAVPVRLIVRRVKPTPGSQLALFTNYSYHACITDREGDTLDLEADHRRHAEIENAIRDLKYGVGLNHLPSGRFPANAAWLAVQVMARWTTRIGLGEPVLTTKTLRRRFLSLAGRLTRKARRLTLHLAPQMALAKPVQ